MPRRRRRVQQKQVKHRNFWTILLVALAVSVIAIGVESNITGLSVKTISRTYERSSVLLEVKDVQGLKTVDMTFGEKGFRTKVFFNQNSNPFPGKVYSSFSIESKREITNMKLGFKIEKRDLLRKGISLRALRLYYDGKAHALSLDDDRNGYVYLSTNVEPGTGNYVLGYKTRRLQ